MGTAVTCSAMNLKSLHGDRPIRAILEQMGASLTVSESQGTVRAEAAPTYGTEIDGSQCPDLVPVLAALASVSQGTTRIFNAQRLRLKELPGGYSFGEGILGGRP